MKMDLAPIDKLIAEALTWRDLHRTKTRTGDIEVLSTNIRLQALRDAKAAMQEQKS